MKLFNENIVMLCHIYIFLVARINCYARSYMKECEETAVSGKSMEIKAIYIKLAFNCR
jgi:hypothetical protein